MIKLIKNELTKIFHKKSIYIMLGIMIFFTVFGIVFSLAFTDETINALDEYSSNLIISSYEEQLKAYDLKDKRKAAVGSGASTPQYIVDEIYNYLITL